ncbi:hypothetical protein ACEWY4_027650 [Coilia grayii]|uniref:NACHT, LRR and PYD domains-containing protein 12-like n=1 Tax=Coilia grayii TaxID=363190 RepID=A0ABD1IP22_9TELE
MTSKLSENNKKALKCRVASLTERSEKHPKPLREINTELVITDGLSEEVHVQHEVRQMEVKLRQERSTKVAIEHNGIFDSSADPKATIRVVMTNGIAGIGKTVTVHKFILDWAEGKANRDIEFILHFPFRHLNLLKDRQLSLLSLILHSHPEMKDVADVNLFSKSKILFIFDGLDESTLCLNFEERSNAYDITETCPVDRVITSLIRGCLLPSSIVWITSRPAAGAGIPCGLIHRWTEVQGFSDLQKLEYLGNQLEDPLDARRLLEEIKPLNALYAMSRIPVICRMLATLFTKMRGNVPTTLTEVFCHYFLIQMTGKKMEEYGDGNDSNTKEILEDNRDEIVKMTQLAFIQLMKGKTLFAEEDLEACGINVAEEFDKSGLFEELVVQEHLGESKVYLFQHLSIQEFLASLFVFYSFSSGGFDELRSLDVEGQQLHHLLQGTVRKSLQSQNGHLDLFLRFLFGISGMKSTQKLLEGLLTHTQKSSEDTKSSLDDTVQYIKNSLNIHSQFPERCMNLLLCLVEMKDQSLHMEAQRYVDRGDMLSPAICSTLAYMMLVSEQTQEVFDLSSYNTTDRGRAKLVTAVRNCRRAQLVSCGLKEDSCKTIRSALQSENSPLKELNLSCNDLQDIGVQVLSWGLSHKNSTLRALRLASCNLTGNSCRILSSVLQSSESHLRELDLTNNNLAAEGVQELSPALSLPSCKLEKLILAGCNLTGESCGALAAALQSGTSHLIHLDLTNNDLGEPGVDKLSEALSHDNCKLEILKLSGCLVSEKASEVLASVLTSKSTCLKELDLSYNHTGDSGVGLRSKLQEKGCHVNIDNDAGQWMKPGLQKYACELTLDVDTAHPELELSEDRRQVSRGEEEANYHEYPDRPQRFDGCPQLLCAEGLSGRHYWEAEWRGSEAVVGVAYRSIQRKAHGADCKIGLHKKSYGLWCEGERYSVRYLKNKTHVPEPGSESGSACRRIGVYLDWPAGTLSFYAVWSGGQRQHLHTYHSWVGEPPRPGFLEPFYPGFWLHWNTKVALRQVA